MQKCLKNIFLERKEMPSAEFNKAADEVKKLKKEPSNDEKLECYALFKVS